VSVEKPIQIGAAPVQVEDQARIECIGDPLNCGEAGSAYIPALDERNQAVRNACLPR